MASIGKFAISAFSGEQETSIGLIQGHFDFSLVKLEAPIEYHGLGSHLSRKRKQEAEEGKIHSTARKIGALFADALPPLQHLKRAYGLRTSEIAENPAFNPPGRSVHGPLKGLVGADGTSIWAAATSGPGALEVHLLACLLARAFPGEEATAIWDELIKTRQAVLVDRLAKETFPASTVFLTRIEISRDMLAAWDASARAWLRTADNARKLQQTQLLHIVENLGLRLPSYSRVYEAVMEIWIGSMSIMNQLIQGIASLVTNPEGILGLCSWHIYPDMSAIGTTTPTFIKQNDALVQQGGVLTLGLQNLNESSKGLSWSVQLQHLTFYGKPTKHTGLVDSMSTRIPFDRVVLIAMGSAMSHWGPTYNKIEELCHFMVALSARFVAESINNSETLQLLRWILLFGQQAQQYISATSIERKEMAHFINFGRRRCNSFLLLPPNKIPPAFGFGNFDNLLSLLSVESQISLLRHVAKTYDLGQNLEDAVIRYDPLEEDEISRTKLPVEYANLVQNRQNGHPPFRRWLAVLSSNLEILEAVNFIGPNEPEIKPKVTKTPRKTLGGIGIAARRAVKIITALKEPCGFLNHPGVHAEKQSCSSHRPWAPTKIIWPDTQIPLEQIFRDLQKTAAITIKRKVQTSEATFEESSQTHQNYPSSHSIRFEYEKLLQCFNVGCQLGALRHKYNNKTYQYLFGSKKVQVYQPESTFREFDGEPTYDCIVKFLSDLPDGKSDSPLHRFYCPGGILDSGYIADAKLHGILSTNESAYSLSGLMQFMRSMKVLESAANIYNRLPDALVEMKVTTQPLYRAKWANENLADSSMDLTQHFACIAFFDTGKVNLPQSSFTNAMAISSGDSLYVCEKLLNDPSVDYLASPVRHLVGNIGRPGLSVLGSVKEPEIRDLELNTWRLVNHHDWDGALLDSFGKTNLQLSLTGFQMLLSFNSLGSQYQEATYVEAVVSAYDEGAWAADIDVLKHHWNILPSNCDHTDSERADSSYFGTIVSVDSWFELIDSPLTSAVVRAKGNWMARLALGSVLKAKAENCVISTGQLCWRCVHAKGIGSRVIVLC
ncbi:hypothetical protein F5Y19DRAFT_34523 [Xylariaceae sp. FL1651]|nr:hypothetical protein F5Y19DRAFT_34523 [Xylariaceae sp. FL1651]